MLKIASEAIKLATAGVLACGVYWILEPAGFWQRLISLLFMIAGFILPYWLTWFTKKDDE